MKIRAENDLKSLDDELNLFDEADWDFLSVIETQDANFEYFNDVRDTDFYKGAGKLKSYVLPILGAVVLGVAITIGVKNTGVFNKDEYEGAMDIKSVTQGTTFDYIDGEEVKSSELLKISGVLNSYFKCLQTAKSYDSLYDGCATTSTFADTYNNATSKVKSLYDKNDCYARMLRRFGSYSSLVGVDTVLYKDDTYYCYIDVILPSSNDIYEYIYSNSYSFSKEFSKYVPTEASIVKYLLELLDNNALSCSATKLCVKLVKVGDSYKIMDDSFVTSVCVDSYTSAINQISRLLKSGISGK